MNLTEKTIRSIVPKEGYLLTQNFDIPLEERVFSELIILGKKESMLNWKEISIEEANKIKEERRKKAEETASKEAKEKRIAELEKELNLLKDE